MTQLKSEKPVKSPVNKPKKTVASRTFARNTGILGFIPLFHKSRKKTVIKK